MEIFAEAVLVLGGASFFLLAMLILRRFSLRSGERRRDGIERVLKPAMLGFLETGKGLPASLGADEEAVLVDVLAGYARLVRGPARVRVADYLERLGVVKRELEALRSRSGWRRAAAAYQLGDMGSARAVPRLIETLDDPDREARAAAARSLGRFRSPDAVEPLLAALVGRQIPEAIVRWALLQVGESALPRLRPLIDHEEPEERVGAVQLIGLLGDATDAAATEARLRDTSALVREQAALALGRLGGARSLPALLAALEDRVPAVRAAAAVALGRLRDPRAAAALLAHAREDGFDPARAAAQALAKLDPGLVAATARDGGIHLREAADLIAAR